MTSTKPPHPIYLLGGALLILGAAFVLATSYVQPAPDPIACTLDAKICPDGSYVGRTGPHCEFEPCPEVEMTPHDPKLPSHETIAGLAKCRDLGMQYVNGNVQRHAWSCDSLPANNLSGFQQEVVYFDDPNSYGFDFPALTYYVSYTPDKVVDTISHECIQICSGVRLMAYIDGKWESIDTLEELQKVSGDIDSKSEALAFVKYATGSKTADEVDIAGLTSDVRENGSGFEVDLFTYEGGICCGTNYEYYKTTYSVSEKGKIEKGDSVHAGTIPNSAIA